MTSELELLMLELDKAKVHWIRPLEEFLDGRFVKL